MNEEIIELINKYEKDGDFTYANISDEVIKDSEKVLGVKLPEQYVSFLKLYGHGGICGIETLGVGLTGRLIFVNVTLDYRNEGLPKNYVAIENVDEWINCIDCNTGKIVSWDLCGYIQEDYECFDDYLIDQMNNAIENI